MIKISRLLAVPVLALGLGACDWQTFQTAFTTDVAAVEAKVAAFVAKVRQDAPIALADAQAAATLVCSLIPVVQSAESAVVANVNGISASVKSTLAQADAYANKGVAACGAYNQTQAANVTPSNAVNTVLAAWNAYVAAKAQISAAQTKVAAGG